MNVPAGQQKKMIPNGNKFKITKHQLQHNLPALLFVGDEAWNEANWYKVRGYAYYLCLPDIRRAHEFLYPITGLSVTAIIFYYPDEIPDSDLINFIHVLRDAGAIDLTVRFFYSEPFRPGHYPHHTFNFRAGE